RHVLRLVSAGGLLLLAAQAAGFFLILRTVADAPAWPLAAFLATPLAHAGAVRMAAALAALGATAWITRRPRIVGPWLALPGGGLAAAGTGAWTSHATARLDAREALLAVNLIHQVASAAWGGALVHLTVLVLGRGAVAWPAGALRAFSRVAQLAV